MKRLILIPLLFLWAQAAVAASPIIVDGHYVSEAIARNAVVWDVRAADAYAKGHIAGAISIGDAAKVLRSFVSLVGPSGSGKSSLLRAVIGLQPNAFPTCT
jgi:rhodanese-related sulfurtransferase